MATQKSTRRPVVPSLIRHYHYPPYMYGTTTPPPANVTPPVVLTLSPSNTKADYNAALTNNNIDVIEFSNGSYSGAGANAWEALECSVDRSGRPLTIRPAFNANPTFVGPAHTDGTIFKLGSTALAKNVTWQGTNGPSSSITFKDFLIASSGVFEPRSSLSCNIIGNIVYTNLKRDTGFAPNPFNAWLFYMDSIDTAARQNDQLIIGDGMQALAPNVARDISCLQQDDASAHTDGTITVRNIVALNSYHYAWFSDIATTSITLDTWTGDNNGHSATPASIRFSGAVNIAGTYKNIHFTNSDPYFDNHSGGGVITNGGGNSGI